MACSKIFEQVSKNSLSVADIPGPYFEEYQELTNVSRQMAKIDLSEMIKKSMFERIGKAGKGIAYQLP